jgi:putative tricarboxylic transport membrane protein
MGKADLWSGIFWLIFSLFASYQSYKLGLGALRQPGPGFLFFWTGIVIAILSVVVIVRSLRKRLTGEAQTPVVGRSNVAKVVFVLLALFVYALLMEWLGFLILTMLLFVFLLRVVERKPWWYALVVSLAITVAAYLVFEKALQSQLPKGLLDFLSF